MDMSNWRWNFNDVILMAFVMPFQICSSPYVNEFAKNAVRMNSFLLNLVCIIRDILGFFLYFFTLMDSLVD